jgi:phytanoyl-CoA hydroxylase
MAFSQAARDFYWEQGYVLLPGLFDLESIAAFERRFEEIVLGEVPRPARCVVMRDVMVADGVVEPEGILFGINKILSFEGDDILFRHSLDADLLQAIRALVGPGVMTISTNVFNKPPGLAGRHPLHQDLRYFTLRPEDRIVAAWTAISHVSRENGCLAVIPGSHCWGLLEHRKPSWEYVNAGFLAAEGVPQEDRVHVEMAPGDTLLFHPLLVHGSGQNRSAGFRRAIATHYASKDCVKPPGERKREPVMHSIPDPPTSS